MTMRFIQWRTICGRDCAQLLADPPMTKKPFHDEPKPIHPELIGQPLSVLAVIYPRRLPPRAQARGLELRQSEATA